MAEAARGYGHWSAVDGDSCYPAVVGYAAADVEGGVAGDAAVSQGGDDNRRPGCVAYHQCSAAAPLVVGAVDGGSDAVTADCARGHVVAVVGDEVGKPWRSSGGGDDLLAAVEGLVQGGAVKAYGSGGLGDVKLHGFTGSQIVNAIIRSKCCGKGLAVAGIQHSACRRSIDDDARNRRCCRQLGG